MDYLSKGEELINTDLSRFVKNIWEKFVYKEKVFQLLKSASKGVEFLFDFYVSFLQSSIILTNTYSFCSCVKGILLNSLSLSSVAEGSGGARNWEMINVALIQWIIICPSVS